MPRDHSAADAMSPAAPDAASAPRDDVTRADVTRADAPRADAPRDGKPGVASGRRPTVADTAQYVIIRILVGLLRPLGWRTASRFGAWLGRFACQVVGIRRDVVQRHVRAAFPAFDEATVRRTVTASYESLGRTALETALLPSRSRAQLLDMVREVEGWELLMGALAQGKGVICTAGHLGNWELGGSYMAARGVPVAAITRRMANPRFDRYLRATRKALDVEVIHDGVAARRVPRALGEGKLIAFLCDQDGIGLASTFVPFFGRPARTPRGPGVFALRRGGTPVLFATCFRRDDGHYRLVIESVPGPDTGDREADIDAVLLGFTERLEAHIRMAPGQYFWQHRRWKRQPPDTPPHLREP
jgi:KDO2-lipid IV(A) lauroyltransferase